MIYRSIMMAVPSGVIHDNGTGQLKLRTNLLRVNNAADTESIATFNEDGAIKLYYDNSKKFETTGAGVTVTGVTTSRGFVLAEDDAIHFRTTASEDLDVNSTGHLQVIQLLINSRNDTIINIDTNNDSDDAHFAW